MACQWEKGSGIKSRVKTFAISWTQGIERLGSQRQKHLEEPGAASGIPAIPDQDDSRFGKVEIQD